MCTKKSYLSFKFYSLTLPRYSQTGSIQGALNAYQGKEKSSNKRETTIAWILYIRRVFLSRLELKMKQKR